MPRKKGTTTKKESCTVDIDNSDQDLSDIEYSDEDKDIEKEEKKKNKKTSEKKPSKKKKNEDTPIVTKKQSVQELRDSLNQNLENKNLDSKKMTKNEYEKRFNELKELYVKLCKEFTEIQKSLREKDSEREEVLNNIRELQKSNTNFINSEIKDINLETTKKETKKTKTVDNQQNLIDRYKSSKSVKKDIIKKPIRDTDMETDDSESEELSDSETDSDSEKNTDES